MKLKSEPSLNYNINQLPSDGYLVLPLSMSRLSEGAGQSPNDCYSVIEYFEKKISEVGVDFVFLYTNGLYYNNDESALSVRKKTNLQMIEHKNKVLKLIKKSKKYIYQAAHFIPWDYIVLNSLKYQEYYLKLIESKEKDEEFRKYLIKGLSDRPNTEANINFIIEEIVVTHLIREQLIDFPKTLVRNDRFRLIIYPGTYLKADLYQWKNMLLPQTDSINPFRASQYNFKEKVLYDFEMMGVK